MTINTNQLPGIHKAAIAVGEALGPRRSRKSVDVGRFRNLNSIQGGKIPSSLQSLGTQTVPYGGSTRYEKRHPGIDIANEIGTPIPSQTGGKVSRVVTGKKQGDKGFGNLVEVIDQYGYTHRYSHLNAPNVRPGQTVQRGTPLGTMGNTGQTYSVTGGTGSHLDYRILDAYRKYVDPYQYLTRYYG